MKTYSIDKILEISQNELRYIDEENNKKSIKLEQCRENWVAHVNSSGEFIDLEGCPVQIKDKSESNCVGTRDWLDPNIG